ncbi:MAG: hypothetical protein K0R71_584 [Bacillales bacterium]|jgi:uncharacterized membrane protein YvbJ|nr:hypothetical protein [Bacillales bacterium]
MNLNTCEYCGKKIERGMTSCSGCGSPVSYIEPEVIIANNTTLQGNLSSLNDKKPMNSIFVILWLFFFFPVGLYFMWARTSWNKVVKIIISIVLALGLIGSLVDDKPADPASTKEKIENVEKK